MGQSLSNASNQLSFKIKQEKKKGGGRMNTHDSMWDSMGCRSHLAAAAPLPRSAQQKPPWTLQHMWKRARSTAQPAFGQELAKKHCCCWGRPQYSASPPFRAAAKPTILFTGNSSHPLLLFWGTLWEGWRALARVPRPFYATIAALQLVQKMANTQSFLMLKKLSGDFTFLHTAVATKMSPDWNLL